MRVALMALNASGGSGVSRYSVELARAFDDVSGTLGDLELTLITTSAGAASVNAGSLEVRIVGGRRAPRGAARLALEQLVSLTADADVLHYFDVSAPLLRLRRPFVTTFHDAAILRPQSHFGAAQRAYKLRLYPVALRHAAAVVAVSAFAREEAVSRFGADARKVTVVHSGPGLAASTPQAAALGRRRPSLLFVGNLTRSKNVPFLIRSFRRADVDAELVLAGRAVDGLGAIASAIGSGRVSERIRVVADPTDAELEQLYAAADAFLFPSGYEGFGFPPLEAMRRDCPVVASDIPAVREVSGSGALLVPLEEGAWTAAIRRVVADPALREELRRRGRETVSRYSWERAAREIARLFVSLDEQPVR